MSNLAIYTIISVAIVLVSSSCGDKLTGPSGSKSVFNPNENTSTPSASGAGNVNDNTGSSDLLNGNAGENSGKKDADANGNANDNSGKSSGNNTTGDTGGKPGGDTTIGDSGSPDAVITGKSGTPWKANTVISDFGTLEKCKADIFAETGDYSICWKCFEQWMAKDQKITAAECGCYRTPGDR